jgi:alcohol dehydrogenase class IV
MVLEASRRLSPSYWTPSGLPRQWSLPETVFIQRYVRLTTPSVALISFFPSHATQTDVVKKVEGILHEQNRHAATLYNIGEHSPISGIRAGVDTFKQSGADIIVSVGGGSPTDSSKAIIYFLHEELGGDFVRQIAIPTTLSAAEYTVRSLLTSFDRLP